MSNTTQLKNIKSVLSATGTTDFFMSQMSQNKMERKSSFRSYSSVVSTSIEKFQQIIYSFERNCLPQPNTLLQLSKKKNELKTTIPRVLCGGADMLVKAEYKINKRDEYSQQNSWIQWKVFFFFKKMLTLNFLKPISVFLLKCL